MMLSEQDVRYQITIMAQYIGMDYNTYKCVISTC